MPIRLLQDMECSGKTVVIRQDLNVPMKDGRITNDKRIRAALPGIRMALDAGANPYHMDAYPMSHQRMGGGVRHRV